MSNTRDLPITISDDERNHKARLAAEKRHEASKLKDEIDEWVKPKKDKLKTLEGEAEELEQAAATGTLITAVECREVKNWDLAEIRMIRVDTGETVEGPRAMTLKERQTEAVDLGAPAQETTAGGKKKRVKLPPPGSQNN